MGVLLHFARQWVSVDSARHTAHVWYTWPSSNGEVISIPRRIASRNAPFSATRTSLSPRDWFDGLDSTSNVFIPLTVEGFGRFSASFFAYRDCAKVFVLVIISVVLRHEHWQNLHQCYSVLCITFSKYDSFLHYFSEGSACMLTMFRILFKAILFPQVSPVTGWHPFSALVLIVPFCRAFGGTLQCTEVFGC